MALPPEAAAINADIVANLLTMRATVYSRATGGPTAGQYTVQEHAGLACLLTSISANSATGVPDRLELASTRVFQYDAAYDLAALIASKPVQIVVDVFPGQRWAPQKGTDDVAYVPGIGIIGKSLLVTRGS